MIPRQSKAFLRILFFVWYILAVLLLATTLAHYAVTYHKGFTFGDILDSPSSYRGMNLSVTGPYSDYNVYNGYNGYNGPLGSSTAGASSFYIIYNKKPVRIDYDQPYVPPRWGEVSIYGEVQADGSLHALRVHNYDYNYLLYLLSFLTGIGVLVFFFHEWKITSRGFVHA